jgi:hypothetical protein
MQTERRCHAHIDQHCHRHLFKPSPHSTTAGEKDSKMPL